MTHTQELIKFKKAIIKDIKTLPQAKVVINELFKLLARANKQLDKTMALLEK